MRNNILGLAAAIALCTATINTGATAANGRGGHSVNVHFRSYFGHGVSWRGSERGGLRHPSILRASAGRLRRRLTSDRSVRTQGRDWCKVALSVSEREKGRGSITSHREGHG